MSTITDPTARMRYLIARTANFRTWVGATAGDEATKLAAALAHVYLLWEDTATVVLPFCTVEWGKLSGERQGMGGGCFLLNQCVITKFYKEYTGKTDGALRLELLTFNAETVAFVNDIKNLSGTGTNIEFQRFERHGNPVATPRSEEDQHWLIDEWEWTGDFWGSQTE